MILPASSHSEAIPNSIFRTGSGKLDSMRSQHEIAIALKTNKSISCSCRVKRQLSKSAGTWFAYIPPRAASFILPTILSAVMEGE
jgi:hypothetical protein